ncbi:PstS family phosphate ABC transporter substrate-binding protein [Paenibacillus macerans]|uniref:PstS family phosphate ABC transporter substrate-binding protein n=1 Tax=Paenibacillus macerans TaxID=44252 RepID=UPI0037C510EB
MMKQGGRILLKVLGCLAAVISILFVGAVTAFITAFMGGQKFYAPLALAVTGILILFVIARTFLSGRVRAVNYVLLGCIAACGAAVGVYEINRAYHNSFAVVSDQDVDLEQYRPFQNNGEVAVLAEPSSLTLLEDLPKMDGATALYPLYSAFAQAVYPRKEYALYDSEVMANTTPGAYKNLLDGRADVIFTAAPSSLQLAQAKRQGLELKLTPIGREAFVFFVHADNPVQGLSTQQIQDIYAGEITDWSEVGGGSGKIRAFQRPEGSGSQTMLQKLMEGKELMAPPQKDVVSGMGGIIAQTADYRNYPNALGYSFLFFATEMAQNGQIRLLEIDGVKPDKTTIRCGEYPLAAEFYAVTAGSDNPNVTRLIEWILSPQGQALVEKTGYTPISPVSDIDMENEDR